MAASTASHRPIKGILKNRSSVLAPAEQSRRNVEELRKKSQRWDDVNVLASSQPAGEECGLVTAGGSGAPRHHAVEAVGGEDDARSDPGAAQAWTPHVSARKVAAAEGSQPRCQTREQECSEGGHTDLSLEEQEKKRQFEMKRKLHYNEGLNIKLARQLLSKDLHDDEEDEEMLETTDGECMNIEESNQGSTANDQWQNTSQSS